MKKVIIAISAVMMFAACGDQKSTGTTTTFDSTIVFEPDSSLLPQSPSDSAKANGVIK